MAWIKLSRFNGYPLIERVKLPVRNGYKEAIVYMFHVDWCPHCKKAMPEWTAFKNQYDGLEINGYVIKCIDIDCTNEKSDVKSAMNKYKITSFPTVKLIKEEQTIDFDSKITRTSLGTFVDTMLK